VNHFQLTGVYLTFKIGYLAIFLWLVKWFGSFLSFDFLELAGLECATGSLDFVSRWTMAAFIPLVILLPFFVGGLCGSIRSMRTLSTLASAIFLYAVETCMEVWACTHLSDGTSYLNSAPDLQCKSGDVTYNWLLAASILLFCMYFFGVQIFQILSERSDETAILSIDFKDGAKLWFLAINLLKWFSLIIALFVSDYPAMQLVAMLCLIMMMLASHSYVLPYQNHLNNTQEIINYVIQIVQLFISLFLFLNITAAARGAPRHDQRRGGWGLRRQGSIQGVCSVDEHQKFKNKCVHFCSSPG